MKTMTTREFFHAPALVKSLHPGQSLLVTDNGKAALVVTKAGKRRRKTLADIERAACQVSPQPGPKVNFTAAIMEIKGR
jgi:hypothetical protein